MNLRNLVFLIIATFYLGACSKPPKTFENARADSFIVYNEEVYQQANQILQADYMFVLDVSASMGFNSGNTADPWASKRAEFMAGLSSFVNSLEQQSINYRIGFINGNVHGNRTSAQMSHDISQKGFYKNILIDWSMSSSTKWGLIDQLQSIGATLNENVNVMLESAHQVMARNKTSFVREGSQLVYLFVSDTDDMNTNISPSDYATKLISHKGNSVNTPAFVSARAIVAGVNAGCTPAGDFGERRGIRLAETAAIIENRARTVASNNQVVGPTDVSRCILRASTEFPTLLSQLARDVSKPTNLFQLRVKNINIPSLKVYVNGSSTPLPNNEWSYQSVANAVKFNTPPAASSQIRITYDPYFVLSGTPSDVNVIRVSSSTGAIIPNSNTNGWSYNPTTNRIELNGIGLPNGSRLEVSY